MMKLSEFTSGLRRLPHHVLTNPTNTRGGVFLIVCYICGQWQLSYLFPIILACLWVYTLLREAEMNTKHQKVLLRREAHKYSSLTQLYTKSADHAIPQWLHVVPWEDVSWLNYVLTLLWPFVKQASEDSITWSLNDLLDYYCPSFLSKLEMSEFDLGTTPIHVTGVKADTSFNNEVTLDLGLEYTGNPDIQLTASAVRGAVGVVAKIEKLRILTTLRICLKPLVGQWPTFSALLIGFAGKPNISFELGAAKLKLDYIPGFSAWLRKFITETLAYYLVWPRKIVIPMLDMSEEELADLYAVVPLGMLTINSLRAAETKVTAKGMMHVTLRLQGEEHVEKSSKVLYQGIKHDEVRFSENFQFPISDPSAQSLNITLWHGTDKVGECDFQCTVLADYLSSRYQQEFNLPFRGKDGVMSCTALWRPFVNQQKSVEGKDLNADSVTSSTASSGVLVVVVHKGDNLIVADVMSSDPYVTLKLGEGDEEAEELESKQTLTLSARTLTIMKCLNPIWEETFSLTMQDINDPLKNILHITCMDWDRFDEDDFMGRVDINTAELTPYERVVRTYTLEGVKSGTVDISLTFLPYGDEEQ